jgi:hypothetical protein
VLRSRAGSFAVVCCLCAGAAAPSEGLAQQANAAAPQFCPAFLISGDLTLFPLNGPEVHVALPAEFPKDFRILASGPDGSSFYGERSAAFGIDKVELNPMHRSVVPGSSAMTEVRALTVEALTGRLLVTGACRSEHTNGIFEIDPAAGTLRVVRAPLEEPISPDGQHVVSRLGKQFSVLDLRGGSVQPIKGLASDARCFWSPNGQRIAAFLTVTSPCLMPTIFPGTRAWVLPGMASSGRRTQHACCCQEGASWCLTVQGWRS